jgi:hypothetical protein
MRLATMQGPLEIGLDYHRYLPAAKMDQAASPALDYAAPHNIGDWFVTKATDRILDYDELLIIHRDAPDREWDVINHECDAMVLKGGNYIQSDWLSREFGLDLLKKIKIPIILFGVGLQAHHGGAVSFTREEAEILRYIHGSTASSSVRGFSTAEALESIGIHNFVVTACPTAYWSRRPEITVRLPHDGRAGFTFRQSLYTDDAAMYKAQFRAIDTVRDRFGQVTVILQGEEVLLQRYFEARRWGAEHEARVTALPGSRLRCLTRSPLDAVALEREIHTRFEEFSRPELLAWFMRNTFFSYDVGEYVRTYGEQGMVIGCRLHSNLVALANGTPAVFLTYDQRTQELVDLFEAPHVPLLEFGPHVDVVGQDWGPFEKNYQRYYAEMRRFLEENALPHTLHGAPLLASRAV